MLMSRCLPLVLIGLAAGCSSSPPPAPAVDETVRTVPPLAAADSAATEAALDAIRAIPSDLFEADRFTASDGAQLPYRLLPPAGVEPGRTYPLVVVFHGAGEIGTDNVSHLDAFPKTWARPEVRSRFPAYVLAPQMPERSALYSGPADDPNRHSQPGQPLYAALDLIDALKESLPVDPKRVYAVGFSMGASTVWNALYLRPDLFAAAIPIAGVPNLSYAARTARTPVWVVHGTADTANPIGPDRAMVEALRSDPEAEVQLWEYDGMGHGVPPALLTGDAFMEWLFEHQR